jgi:hypothetical protein
LLQKDYKRLSFIFDPSNNLFMHLDKKGLGSMLLAILLLATTLSGCKKAVDKAVENAAYEIITNGRWSIIKMEKGTTSLLAEYASYEFQFYKGGVVTAYLTGSPNTNGTWLGKEDVLAIESNFPGVDNPLKRLNGTWLITGATEVSVKGTRTEGSDVYTLWLKKI